MADNQVSQTSSADTPASAAGSYNKNGLGVLALAAIVVSSMLGGGIYSLPQNMAAGASAGAVLLAWLITGFGIYFIARTFSILSMAKPDLKTGIYSYSRAGFGPYVGFTIGWSYWLCQVCGNVGYAVITMDALNYFFPPYFAGGNNLASIIGGSLIIWGFNYLVLRGVRQASYINTIGTIVKIVPLVLFILILLFVFKFSRFDFDFWGEAVSAKVRLGGLSTQIKSTMLVTLWAFIGIEGAVVMSNRARTPGDVGKATILGFISCLAIYVLLSLLPFGYMSQAQLAAGARSFAAARQAAVEPLRPGSALAALLDQPNNNLAVEYCKAILELDVPLTPIPLPRQGANHGEALNGNVQFASASALRALWTQQGVEALRPYVPEAVFPLYQEAAAAGSSTDFSAAGRCELALLRARCTGETPFAKVRGVSEGLEHRLEKAVRASTTLDELLNTLTTIRYPRARMRRLAMDASLGYTEEAFPALPPYLHLLGARRELLGQLKQAALPASPPPMPPQQATAP